MIKSKHRLLVAALMFALGGTSCVGALPEAHDALQTTATPQQGWAEDFNLSARQLAPSGKSEYFNLTPGFRLVLASANSRLTITVLGKTREIGGTTTRVVEEREEANGSLSEVSTNYYAMDQATGDVFYYGEEVDFYTNGAITGHEGAWLAHEKGNRPGLIMMGNPQVGAKYYQELAPGVAADRAKIVSVSESITTSAGDFENCVLIQETSKIEVTALEYKTYCPGVGLVQDQSLLLVSYGMTDVATP